MALAACGGSDPLPREGAAAPPHRTAVSSVAPPTDRVADGVVATSVTPAAVENPKVLDAPPGLLLVSNLRNYSVPAPQAATSAPASGAALRLAVTALPTVTVGEVNRTLLSIGARIVEMRAHDLMFSIEAADVDSAVARDRVVGQLEASKLFESIQLLN
jgi:hypothetical protein